MLTFEKRVMGSRWLSSNRMLRFDQALLILGKRVQRRRGVRCLSAMRRGTTAKPCQGQQRIKCKLFHGETAIVGKGNGPLVDALNRAIKKRLNFTGMRAEARVGSIQKKNTFFLVDFWYDSNSPLYLPAR